MKVGLEIVVYFRTMDNYESGELGCSIGTAENYFDYFEHCYLFGIFFFSLAFYFLRMTKLALDRMRSYWAEIGNY